MSTDQHNHHHAPPNPAGHEPPPFFGGNVAIFWPLPYGPEGGDGYTVAQARDAMSRAFRMARFIAADTHGTGAGHARAATLWESGPDNALLLFALGSTTCGLAVQLARLEGRSDKPSFMFSADDIAHGAGMVELVAKAQLGTGLAYARAMEAEATAAGDHGPMRGLALAIARIQAEMLAQYGKHTDMPPLMVADVMLAAVPHAFATEAELAGEAEPPVTDSGAADHAESPRTLAEDAGYRAFLGEDAPEGEGAANDDRR